MCGSSRNSSARLSRSRTADFAPSIKIMANRICRTARSSKIATLRACAREQNDHSARVTIFLGCGFAAKYREGGGNFSVPLQWILGLRRLKLDAIWLELLPATGKAWEDRQRIENFQRRLREHGLANRYCLIYQEPASDTHELKAM